MPRKWKPEEYQYQQGYIKGNIKFVSIPFNMRNEEDAELYEYLNRIDEKKASYIKGLIRRDIEEPIDAYRIVFNRVKACVDCNTCGKQRNCEYRPEPGGTTRINCPLWESK